MTRNECQKGREWRGSWGSGPSIALGYDTTLVLSCSSCAFSARRSPTMPRASAHACSSAAGRCLGAHDISQAYLKAFHCLAMKIHSNMSHRFVCMKCVQEYRPHLVSSQGGGGGASTPSIVDHCIAHYSVCACVLQSCERILFVSVLSAGGCLGKPKYATIQSFVRCAT